ncbi:MAG: hypothetical protein DMF61_14505 [Blastocatellia bacterium AA13]|nr:MAG: hypothetical protein DMF61_14505 [Blastocatellia bacterium AA13]
MDNLFLSHLVVEIRPAILNKQINTASMVDQNLVLGFDGLIGQRLLVGLDPASPALYLARRWPKSKSRHPGASLMKLDQLNGMTVTEVSKHPSDRLVRLTLLSPTDSSKSHLVLSMTGRAANVFLFDNENILAGRLLNRKGPIPEWNWKDEPEADDSAAAVGEGSTAPLLRLGAQLERESSFRAEQFRDAGRNPSDVLRELLSESPKALVYSSIPLDQIGTALTDPIKSLALSSVELTHLAGYSRYCFETFSEAAESYYAARQAAASLLERLSTLRRELTAAVRKRGAQLASVESDLEKYSDPDRFRKFGDLILASLNSARIAGESIRLIDYFDPEQKEIEIPLPPKSTLKQAAAHYYQLHSKARRALEDLVPRAKKLRAQLDRLTELLTALTDDPSSSTLTRVRAELDKALGKQTSKSGASTQKRPKRDAPKPQGRRFESSDGFEIIVGRTDVENDSITFRIAGSQDVWLHAADYPGSHVMIRNPSRQAVPHRTIVEAAQLAAFYSSAKNEKKAAVHYTQKKFVSKPPRAKPGLVRLSSFKTVMVEPNRRVGGEKNDQVE